MALAGRYSQVLLLTAWCLTVPHACHLETVEVARENQGR
jgi:hypothetical protein